MKIISYVFQPSDYPVVSYSVKIKSRGGVTGQVLVDGSAQRIEQPVDFFPTCLEGELLHYTATVTAINSMGESEEQSTGEFGK